MNAKENFLEAIYYQRPHHVPLGNEEFAWGFSFEDIVKMDNWTDRWGIRWEMEIKDTVPFPKVNPLSDITHIDDYVFPSPSSLVLSEKSRDGIKQIDQESKLLFGNMSYLLFERAWALMGMENFFMALIDYPNEMHLLLHGIASYAKGVFDRYLELGVDGIGFSEDLGSQKALMLSPILFREFLLPEYNFIFENVRNCGKIINFHSCGCVDAIAGDLADIGVTILNPVQARANDLVKLKKSVHGKMALWGGIDTQLLLTGTPEEIKEETKRVMGILKPGGGYICAPDQFFPNMPQENLKALWYTAAEHGLY